MRKYFFVLVVLALVSCNSKSDELPDQPKTSTTFSFEKIEYRFTPESVFTDEETIIPDCTISNSTSAHQTFVYDLAQNVPETAIFQSSDPRAFTLATITQPIPTPSASTTANQIWLESSPRWSYNSKKQKLESDTNIVDEIGIAPKTKMTFGVTVKTRHIEMAYRLTLRGDQAGEIVEINGIWSCNFLLSRNMKVQWDVL